MNAHKAAVNVSLATASAIVTGLLVCITPIDASAESYTFSNHSQGWQYMGLYLDGGLTPSRGFVVGENPWTWTDGNGGAILLGQEGFNTPLSLSGWVHGDLNSPRVARVTGQSVRLMFDVTGSHMRSTRSVLVQAVLLVTPPNGSDRRLASDWIEVPIGDDGAWDTHSVVYQVAEGTVVKMINLRVFFESSARYDGWIMVDNVILK